MIVIQYPNNQNTKYLKNKLLISYLIVNSRDFTLIIFTISICLSGSLRDKYKSGDAVIISQYYLQVLANSHTTCASDLNWRP